MKRQRPWRKNNCFLYKEGKFFLGSHFQVSSHKALFCREYTDLSPHFKLLEFVLKNKKGEGGFHLFVLQMYQEMLLLIIKINKQFEYLLHIMC